MHLVKAFAGENSMHIFGAVRGPWRIIKLRELRRRRFVRASQQDISEPGSQCEIGGK